MSLERGISYRVSPPGSGVLEAMALTNEDHLNTLKVKTYLVCANQEEFKNLVLMGELLTKPWLRNRKSNSSLVNILLKQSKLTEESMSLEWLLIGTVSYLMEINMGKEVPPQNQLQIAAISLWLKKVGDQCVL